MVRVYHTLTEDILISNNRIHRTVKKRKEVNSMKKKADR